MKTDPELYIAALARIGETCERLLKEGASTTPIVAGLLSVANAFATVSILDDLDAVPPNQPSGT